MGRWSDSLLAAAMTLYFKMLLPLDFERENNKMFEEVTIPPNSQIPVNMAQLVSIASLDEVCYSHTNPLHCSCLTHTNN